VRGRFKADRARHARTHLPPAPNRVLVGPAAQFAVVFVTLAFALAELKATVPALIEFVLEMNELGMSACARWERV